MKSRSCYIGSYGNGMQGRLRLRPLSDDRVLALCI